LNAYAFGEIKIIKIVCELVCLSENLLLPCLTCFCFKNSGGVTLSSIWGEMPCSVVYASRYFEGTQWICLVCDGQTGRTSRTVCRFLFYSIVLYGAKSVFEKLRNSHLMKPEASFKTSTRNLRCHLSRGFPKISVQTRSHV
jgi:hypothetical protein